MSSIRVFVELRNDATSSSLLKWALEEAKSELKARVTIELEIPLSEDGTIDVEEVKRLLATVV